jgi:hypothetical protein
MDGLTWLRAQWDRAAGWALILLGAALVGSASVQARDALYVPEQFSFLMSGGVGGVATAALGCALLLSAGFHDEWRRLDRIEAALGRQRTARSAGSNGSGPKGASKAPPAPASLALRVRAQWDRALGWTLVVVALAWLLVGYRSLADSLYPTEQVSFLISSGLVALLLLFVGAGALLLADWRDGRHKLDRIALLRGQSAGWQAPGARVLAVGALVAVVVGSAAVAVGYTKAADALRVDPALDGLVVAGAGLGVILVALGLIALRLRLTIGTRLRAVLSGVVAEESGSAPAVGAAVDLSDRWTADGLRRYHRAACPALRSAQHEHRPVRSGDNGLEPCLICGVGE